MMRSQINKKQIEGQMELHLETADTDSRTKNIEISSGKKTIVISDELYKKATLIAQEKKTIHLGTLMRCLHISALEAETILYKMEENSLIGQDHRILSATKNSWHAGR